MKNKKMFLKTIYCLAGLFFVASIGLNVFQYQQFKELSKRPVTERITKNKPVIDSTASAGSTSVKQDQKSTTSVTKEEESNASEIDKLEYHLQAATEELDMTYDQLDEELYKRAEYKKARDILAKSMSSLSNPVNRKMIRDSLTQILGNDYDPLYKKLSISEEEFDEFKGILVDEMMEREDLYASYTVDSSDEEKEKLSQQAKEINGRYESRISGFLGVENTEEYQNYRERLTERRNLREFMETLPPDNRINEERGEILIDSMYEARKMVNNQMGPFSNNGSSFELTEETLAQMAERSARVNEAYVGVSRGIMTPEQIEQYEVFLKRNLELTESSLEMSLYLKDKNE